MKIKRNFGMVFVVAILFGAIGIGYAVIGATPNDSEAAADPQLVVALRGTAEMYAGDDGACFDVDLVNLYTNQVIGTATDCIADIKGIGAPISMNVLGTTTFNFPQGSLTSRGRTTVQHLLDANGDVAVIEGFTHATGSPAPAGNTIVPGSGTKAFKNAEGVVRLSGLVNLEHFVGDPRPGKGPEITFDCIFVIDLF